MSNTTTPAATPAADEAPVVPVTENDTLPRRTLRNHPNGITAWVDHVEVGHAWTTANASFRCDVRTCPTADHRGAALQHWSWGTTSSPQGITHTLSGGSLVNVDPFTVDPAHPLHSHVQAIILAIGATEA